MIVAVCTWGPDFLVLVQIEMVLVLERTLTTGPISYHEGLDICRFAFE